MSGRPLEGKTHGSVRLKYRVLDPAILILALVLINATAPIGAQVLPPGAVVDGIKDPQYSAEYSKYRFFNYGPNPNMASGEVYSFSGLGANPDTPNGLPLVPTMFVYYAQNPRDMNDNSYGISGSAQEYWHVTWQQGSGHQFTDLTKSDHTEFIFYDSSGNIKLSFFSDYTGETVPYHSLGFTAADGQVLINNTGLDPAILASKMRFESSLAWNLNVLTNGSTSINCGNGVIVNPREESPPLTYGNPPNYSLYQVNACTPLNDWEFTYAIELSIPLSVFPGEPVVEIVARAHNSPPKSTLPDVPSEPAQASIGDYVWFDWDHDAQQDSFENGIPNVRVLLYWDRDNNGVFEAEKDELLVTTRTDANGYYLFKGLNGGAYTKTFKVGNRNVTRTFYNGEYKVDVDESTLPGGVSTALIGGANTHLLTGVTTTGQPVTVTPASMTGISQGTQLLIGGTHPETVTVSSVTSTTFTATYNYVHYAGSSVSQVIPAGQSYVTPASMDGIYVGRQLLIGGLVSEVVTVSAVTSTTFQATFLQSHAVGNLVTANNNFELTTNNEPYILSDNIPGAERGTLQYPEACRTADFGYRPSGGVIGDFVWSDADNDGIQDAGEAGIPGVTVRLLDASDNPVQGVPSGNPTTTNAFGNYLFYGLSAGTYHVEVTDTANVLQGYQLTVGPESKVNPTYEVILSSATQYPIDIYQDFGYYNPNLGRIGDTVFFDMNWSQFQDAGEPGIPNVTLSIWRDSNNDGFKDASDQFITSTVTDSQGKYYFTGLPVGPGDVRYFVQVTDNNSALVNYEKYYAGVYKTTILNDGDREDLDVDFPYVAVGLIGNFVWNDINHNGIQETGEPGIPGVVVTLEKWDTATSAWASWASTTANDQGYYEFAGLQTTQPGPVGTQYRVSLTTPAGGWQPTLIGVGGTALDSNATPSTTTLGGVPGSPLIDVSIDFGFYQPTVVWGSIGDYIWEDLNENGLQDDGLPSVVGFANVTLELRNASGQTLQSTTTDANGAYHFYGLGTSVVYTVVVTDINHVLDGYVMTTSPNVMTPRSANGTARVMTGGENYLIADAGYKKRPTFVSVSGFRAFSVGGTVVVEWRTAAEIKTAGFRVLRVDPVSGNKVSIWDQIVPAMFDAPAGGTYRLVDPSAFPSQTYSYFLEEVENKGSTQLYGPFLVTAVSEQADISGVAPFEAIRNEPSEAAKRRVEEHKLAKETHAKLKKKGPILKLFVSKDGLYYVSAASIADGMGADPAAVQRDLLKGEFNLMDRGEETPYVVATNGAGLYFYGCAPGGIYARDNVYWLRSGKGSTMASLSAGKVKAAPGPATFIETVRFEEDISAVTTVVDDPESDYWFWAPLMAHSASLNKKTLSFRTPGVASSQGTATLRVDLQGLTESPALKDHKVTVKLNGTGLGQEEWDGKVARSLNFTFSSGLLKTAVPNTLELISTLNPGVRTDTVLIDGFEVSYERLLQADENRLSFQVAGTGILSVNGFSQNSITVIEISDSAQPKIVSDVKVESTGAGYRAGFTSLTPNARYLAVASSAIQALAEIRADTPSDLIKNKGADYVIITSGGMVEATAELAEYRTNAGLVPLIVDVEDIMDEFNHGISSPYAIRDFLKHALDTWKTPPRYVAIVGDGSYDYRNIKKLGTNQVPTLMVSTTYGLFPSDNALADVNGDFVPDVAIGRIPVLTPEELASAIDRIAAYEQGPAGPWVSKAVFMSDDADPDAGDFPEDSDTLAGSVPSSYDLAKLYLSQMPIAQARQTALVQLNQGCSVWNYVGHGAYDSLAYESLITADTAQLLSNGQKLPVFTAWSCYVGNFGMVGFDSLAEVLMGAPGGGIVAGVASTGLSENDDGVAIGKEFYSLRFGGGNLLLGDILRGALEKAAAKGVTGEALQQFGLIGDPALRMR